MTIIYILQLILYRSFISYTLYTQNIGADTKKTTRTQFSLAHWLFDNVRQIVDASHALQLYSGNILQTTDSHQHHIMFLQIVSDSRHISDHLLAGSELDQDAFSIGGIRLLRFLDKGLQDDAFCKGFSVKWSTWRTRFKVWTRAMHLVERSHVARLGFQHGGDSWVKKKKKKQNNQFSMHILKSL